MKASSKIVAKVLVATFGACLLVAAAAAPAMAASSGSNRDDSRISVTGPVRVAAGERIVGPVVSVDGPVRIDGAVKGDVLSIHGGVTISGRVTGTVTALDGDIRVSGTVHDGVTAISGRAIVGAGAVVGGAVRSSERPSIAPTAHVTGDVSKTNFAVWFTVAGWIALVLWWIAVTVTLLVLGLLFVLLFPRAAQVIEATGRQSVGVAIGWGALLGIGLPLVAGVLAATVIGLPLGLGVVVMLAAAFPVGYVAAALVIGRTIGRRTHDVVAFLIGFAILRALAIIPGLGWLLGFLAAGFGIGVLAVAAWRAGRAPSGDAPVAPAPQPTPAVPE